MKLYKVERIGTGQCPRCNAEGPVFVQKRKRTSHFWEQVFRCPKCRYQCAVPSEDGSGPFLSDVQKRAIDARRILRERFKAAKTPAERGKIMAAVRAIDAREKDWLSSL